MVYLLFSLETLCCLNYFQWSVFYIVILVHDVYLVYVKWPKYTTWNNNCLLYFLWNRQALFYNKAQVNNSIQMLLYHGIHNFFWLILIYYQNINHFLLAHVVGFQHLTHFVHRLLLFFSKPTCFCGLGYIFTIFSWDNFFLYSPLKLWKYSIQYVIDFLDYVI